MCLFLANFLSPEPAGPEGNCPPKFFAELEIKKKMFHEKMIQAQRNVSFFGAVVRGSEDE